MATTIDQPLLFPKPKSSYSKPIFIILSLATIISLTSVITIHLIKSDPTDHVLISNQITPSSNTATKLDFLKLFLRNSTIQLQKAIKTSKNVRARVNSPTEEAALLDCEELMDLSIDRIQDSIDVLNENPCFDSVSSAHSWLSSVLTNHMTCFDGLKSSSLSKTLMDPYLDDLINKAKSSLSIFVSVFKPENELSTPSGRRFPTWVTRKDRRLLMSGVTEINANVVVAKDGSGKYKTVSEAVNGAPDNSKTRYVIYVKKGLYKENVDIGKKKKNLMITGDGMELTIITGSLNVVDGSTTFKSATLAAVGDGFIAQDIWFQNTAGPEKHQAVALRVGADQSIINRCKIDAYQDTLYTHTNRQFYKDCSITGTVDFIFGNAAVVFQSCKLIARKPMKGQTNMVTAQGRMDPNQNTGTSIQQCDIIGSSDLESSTKSYLGRPWKEYSRTVVMQSNIGGHIDPTGWAPWAGDFALKTLYYGEYMNKGPGAGVSKRVNWVGFHVITDPKEAIKFTVTELIQGQAWIKSSGVTFIEGL